MRKKHRIIRSVFIVALALCLFAADLTPAFAGEKSIQAQINALKNDANSLTQQKKELKNKLSALSSDITNNRKKKELLDSEINVLTSEISNAEEQIATYGALITQSQQELEEAQAREEAQYDLFCQRVRAMEEQGKVDYWSVLFRATSFSDLLGRLDIINEIMKYDQGIINDLKDLQAEIAERKTTLEGQKADSEAAKASLESKRAELDEQRDAANALVKELQENEADAKAELDAINAEEETIQARMVKLSKELAAQQAASGQSSPAALGGYIWPVGSRRITSPFGNRNTGISGASTNHKGVDIGGVGYTSEVRAAKAGTVIISQYSSSYGNYVAISHGSGNTTLYAHLSSRKVTAGQRVEQGQVVGITGSTGISSGPHLHFEITENGSRVDPLKYLTGYVRAW